jgi:hypothetical protein
MSRTKQKRKQADAPAGGAAKKAKSSNIITPPPDQSLHEPKTKTIQSIGLEHEDLELAIDTLNTLATNPSVIKSKACKDIRTAVHQFRQACTTGFNAAGGTIS